MNYNIFVQGFSNPSTDSKEFFFEQLECLSMYSVPCFFLYVCQGLLTRLLHVSSKLEQQSPVSVTSCLHERKRLLHSAHQATTLPIPIQAARSPPWSDYLSSPSMPDLQPEYMIRFAMTCSNAMQGTLACTWWHDSPNPL